MELLRNRAYLPSEDAHLSRRNLQFQNEHDLRIPYGYSVRGMLLIAYSSARTVRLLQQRAYEQRFIRRT